jgi:hypothetical protein
MTDRERRQYDDRLAEDAQRRYERMTDPERRRYMDDLQNEQRRLDIARRRQEGREIEALPRRPNRSG